MPAPFSLLNENWIPVATAGHGDGPERREFVRLCDISRPDILRVSTGRPDCDISLTEFLIGMLAIAIGPADDDEWHDHFANAPSADELDKAFAPFAEALVLDGDGPRFFQDLEPFEVQEESGKLKRIEQLFFDAPGEKTLEDNGDHFVKRGNTRCLSRSGVAIALIAHQTAAPGGGSGILTSLRGGGPATTLVVPGRDAQLAANLWRLLWINTPSDFRIQRQKLDRVFPWLAKTRTSERDTGCTTTPGDVDKAQAFFGMPRRVRVVFEGSTTESQCDLLVRPDTTVARKFATRKLGTKYEAWGRLHPLSPYYRDPKDKAVYRAYHIKSSRFAYCDWIGSAVQQSNEDSVPAQTVFDFYRRCMGLDTTVRSESQLLAAGYVFKPGQATALDYAEALLPLIVGSSAAVNEQIRDLAGKLVGAADVVARQLVASVKLGLFGETNKKPDSDSAVLKPVGDRFWADTENDFFDQLREAAKQFEAAKDDLQDQAGGIQVEQVTKWLAALKRHALTIFDDAVPIEAAEAKRIEDVVAARKYLLLALTGYGPAGNKVFKELELQSPDQKPRRAKASSKQEASP